MATRRGGHPKLMNEYADLLPYYRDIPKAVLAAIAVSTVTRDGGDDNLSAAAARVAREWEILHDNGIVRQKPCELAADLSHAAGSEI